MRNKAGKIILLVFFLSIIVTLTLIGKNERVFADGQAINDAFYSRGLQMCYLDNHMASSYVIGDTQSGIGRDTDKVAGITSFNTPDDLDCSELLSKLGYNENAITNQSIIGLGYEPISGLYTAKFNFLRFNDVADGLSGAINTGKNLVNETSFTVKFKTDESGKVDKAMWQTDGMQKAPDDGRTIYRGTSSKTGDYIQMTVDSPNSEELIIEQDGNGGFSCRVNPVGKTPQELVQAIDQSFRDCMNVYNKSSLDGVQISDFIVNSSQSGVTERVLGFYYYPGQSEPLSSDQAKSRISTTTDGNTNSFRLKSNPEAFQTAYKTIFNKDFSESDSTVTQEQQAVLYQTYLTDFYKLEIHESCASEKEKAGEGAGLAIGQGNETDWMAAQQWHLLKLFSSDGSAKYCYARANDQSLIDKTVHGIKEEGANRLPMMAGERIGLKDISNWMLESSPSSITAGALEDFKTVSRAGESDEKTDGGQPEVTCQNSGGAGSLGWIVCSILDWMANATEFMYDNIVEPALRIEPELFTTTGGQGQNAEAAWRIFRDFANIIFIILLLIVIFSQLTGYGIDNYGIKKILPKFIIVAVLVNLSYLICLICVDLSNIVGNSIQDVFNGMTGQISANITIDPLNGTLPAGATSNVAVDVGARAGIAAVTIAGLAVGAYALYSNPALLLTLFISVLGVLISVLFVFILLAGRKAAIVLLTVVSPIAFILYMLPNTKKIYDKWFNLWKAMLLVYPICGLLIGGGNFASQLMLGIGQNTSTPAASVFTAMIVGIVPIFFIPTVIKSAYAALGSIGGTLAGFGGRLRGGATRRLNNSDINRRLQERGQERRTRVRAGVDRHGNEINLNGFQRFMRGGRRSVARSRAQYVKDQETLSRENSMMGNGFTAALAGAESRVQDDAVKNEEAIIMNDSSLRDDNVALRNGLTTAILNRDSNKIRAYQNILSRKGENGREHVRGAMEDALRRGNVSDAAKRDYASNLINKWGADYKNNNRSTFDYANNVLDGAAATLGANGTKVSSLKQSTLASMDEAELIRTINGASGAELADLQNLAHDALQNETVRNNMKEGTRRELEVLASNSAKAAAAQQSEAQAQAAQQQRDQSMNDLNDQLQQIRTQSQSEIAQDMGQYESTFAVAGQPTQKIRVQMRRDGKYINADNGQEIDIGRYRKI